MDWYVIQAYSGYEQKVKIALEEKIELNGLSEKFGEILIPTEQIVELKGGTKKTTERKFFPGYILIKMDLTDQAWHIVNSHNRVTGFLGAGGKPMPISDAEAERLIKQVTEGIERTHSDVIFEIGEWVRVAEGPFASFKGLVEEVDEDKSRLKVTVSIFGRSTPVDLEFSQVEKST